MLRKKVGKIYGISRTQNVNDIFLPYKHQKNFKKNFIFFKKNLSKDLKFIVNLVKKKKIEYIVNFISQGMVDQSWDSPLDWYYTNVMNTITLAEELNKLKFIKKFLHISTPEVYGNIKKKTPENINFRPSTPYAVSRTTTDLHLMNMAKQYNFPVVFSRAANIYGPSQQLYRIIPKILSSLIFNEKMFIDGNGNTTRSYVYIDDVCEGYYKILFKGKIGNCYHLSSKKLYSINRLLSKIKKITKIKKNRIIKRSKDRRGKDLYYNLESEKIANELNWSPKTSLDKGILETKEWILKNSKIIKKLEKDYIHKK